MTSFAIQCDSCAHHAEGAQTCKAFPEGIPDKVYAGYVQHTKSIRGDHGLRYKRATTVKKSGLSAVLKYNPNHDKLGRFSSKAGGKVVVPYINKAAKLAKEKNKRDYDVKQVVAEALGNDKKLIAQYYGAIEAANKAVSEGKATNRLHTKNGDGTGGYTKARKELHKKIIAHELKNMDDYRPKNGEIPTFMILGGRGGSGKSNLENKGADSEFGVYSRKTSFVVDPDRVKEMLPEYNPEQAYLVHEESAYIADLLLATAKKEGLNVVTDITLRNDQRNIVNRFQKAGYRTEAHFMHKEPKSALTSAVRRWNRKEVILNPLTGKATVFSKSRLVPPFIIEGNVDNEANFDKIARKVDNWSLTTNESPSKFKGRRVASGVKKAMSGFSSLFPEHLPVKLISHSGFSHILKETCHMPAGSSKGGQFTSCGAKGGGKKGGKKGKLSDEVKAAKYKKYSATMLKKFKDKTFYDSAVKTQALVDKYGAGSAKAKKAVKNHMLWLPQAKKWGATDEFLDQVMADTDAKMKEGGGKPGFADVIAGGAKPKKPPKQKTAKDFEPDYSAAVPAYSPSNDEDNILAQNLKIGSTYYALRAQNGQDHPATQKAYKEWNKTKDALKADHGYSDTGISELSFKAKNEKFEAMPDIGMAIREQGQALAAAKEDGVISAAEYSKAVSPLIDAMVGLGLDEEVMESAFDPPKQVAAAKAKLEAEAKYSAAESTIKSAAMEYAKAAKDHGVKSSEAKEAMAVAKSTAKQYKAELKGGGVTGTPIQFANAAISQAKKDLKTADKLDSKFALSPQKASDHYDSIGDFPEKVYSESFAKHGLYQIKNLSQKETEVLVSYTGDEFTDTNRAIGRAGTAAMLGKPADPIDPELRERMLAMDAVFAKTTLGENVGLRRNSPQKYFWEQFGVNVEEANKEGGLSPEFLKSMEGKVYKETAYSSTSMRQGFNHYYSKEASKTGAIKLNIRATGDQRGIRVAAISGHPNEKEVILPRGTTYVIRGLRPMSNIDSNYKYEVDVDVIGVFPDKI